MVHRRRQWFEFNDASWAPEGLKESLIEALSLGLDLGQIVARVVPPFEAFIAAAGATEVLDICSGAGSPASILIRTMKKHGKTPPRFLLTDLMPHMETWQSLKKAEPTYLDFIAKPVDATSIDPKLSKQRARVIMNAFHHFQPELASAMLFDAVRSKVGIFISEPFERGLWGFPPFVPLGLTSLLLSPLVSKRRRLAKVFYNWLTPIGMATGIWDGVISSLRVYTEAELRAMVAPIWGVL